MTTNKLERGYQLQNEINRLSKAEIKVPSPSFVADQSLYSVLTEFFDIEEYNRRIAARREGLQKEFDAL